MKLRTRVGVLAVKAPAVEAARGLLGGTLEGLNLRLKRFNARQLLEIVAHNLIQALAHVLRGSSCLLGNALVNG
jgi:hypothetical protein